MHRPKPLSTPSAAIRWIAENAARSGAVYVAGCGGEPRVLADAFCEDPDAANDLTFFGVWIPGANRTDWASLSDATRGESNFVSPDWATSFAAGDFRFLALTYSEAWRWVARRPCDVAVLQVSPPNVDGLCSFGVSADFSPAFLNRDIPKLGIVNTSMPFVLNGPTIRYAEFDAVLEADYPLATLSASNLNPAFERIGAHIAGLIRPGDTLQFGLGKVQSAVLGALKDHSDLRIHSGMVSDPFLEMLEGGVVRDAPDAAVMGVALGSQPLIDGVSSDPRIRFAPVSYTHDGAVLAQIDNLVAINSVMQVDLFGQANAEFLGGRQISGAGGLTDFLRGAAASKGGRPVVALNASAKSGSVSRITPKLDAPAVGVSRADIRIVVTENGVADLQDLDLDARAEALIAIADPAHQSALSSAWRDIRMAL